MGKTVCRRRRGGHGRSRKSRKSPGNKLVDIELILRILPVDEDDVDEVNVGSLSDSAKTQFTHQVNDIVNDPDLSDAVRIQENEFKSVEDHIVVQGKLNTKKFSKKELEDYIHALNEKSIWQQPSVDSHGKQYKFFSITVKFV